MNVVACSVVVSGRVQGVGFRRFVQRSAQQMGVSGWVRNLADGSVECQAEGDPVAVEQFLQDVRRGPSLARVDSCQVRATAPIGGSGFTIR